METSVQQDKESGQHGINGYSTGPGEFPLDALSPVMREIAASVADAYQVPPSMPAMAALAIHAGAMGKAYQVINAVHGHQSYGNLYVIIAADRGGGKSTVATHLARPLIDANRELAVRFLPKKVEQEAKATLLQKQVEGLLRRATKNSEDISILQKELEDKKRELAEVAPSGLPIPIPSLIEGNVTSEALAATLMVGDQSLMIYSSEAGDFVRVALGKYSKGQQGDFDLLLAGWSSETTFRNRVGSGRCNLDPTLSVLLFVQPYILAELMGSEEAFERGLTARPLIFDPKLELTLDDGVERLVPGDVTTEWSEYIHWLTKSRPSLSKSLSVHCSTEAQEIFRRFHNESIQLRRGACADVSGELSRWRENAIRIALNLWLADSKGGDITGEQADRAVRIMRWCGFSYLTILNQGRGARKYAQVQKLRGILVETPARWITLRNLANRHGYDQGEVRALVADFPDLLKIEAKLPGSQGGRPSEILIMTTATGSKPDSIDPRHLS